LFYGGINMNIETEWGIGKGSQKRKKGRNFTQNEVNELGRSINNFSQHGRKTS